MGQFTRKGSAAVAAATAEQETKVSAHVPFPSGTTLKVRILSAEDSAEYYAHSIFGKVPTFVPKTPAERNDRGFITGNPSLFDRAAELLYADAKAAKDAGDESKAEKLRNEAYLYKSKPRYLVGFGNLETGELGFVDLTPKQAKGVFATISKYAKKLDKLAFELSKTGSSTNTAVTLSPILDIDDEDELTKEQRANFDKLDGKSFDFGVFDGFLFEADEAEQATNLVKAGFDISRLGLTIGSGAVASDNIKPIDDDRPIDISEDDLPF